MQRSYAARCLVLKKTKLGELDSIATLLGSDGHQVRAVAKGARRPGSRFGARLEPFAQVDVLLHAGRSLEIVREARSVRTNAGCREDFEKAAACAVIAEFLERTTRDAAVEPRVFDLAAAAFAAVDGHDPARAGLYSAAFLLKAFAMMGVGPALRCCAVCGEPVKAAQRFDIAAGGVLCASCDTASSGPGHAAASTAKWVDYVLYSTFAQLDDSPAPPTRDLLDVCEAWCAEHLSVRLRSLPFLKGLC